jgi:2-polyprenyl-6-hydroxyphenyl methylase/3-demethylubiquinone-9 3-methyltransferase
MPTHQYQEFGYTADAQSHMHGRIAPAVLTCASPLAPSHRVLDIGCGKGALLKEFAAQGCEVVGVDLSEQGITLARKDIPGGRFEVLGADANLLDVLGEAPFDLVISTEVVEHVYAPREWARACHHALKPGGRLICSTPYHGYLKNVLLSLLNKWDTHADPLWDGGHIKLWSRRTLTRLLTETGFRVTGFHGVGRFPGLWMTMVVTAQKAANPPA